MVPGLWERSGLQKSAGQTQLSFSECEFGWTRWPSCQPHSKGRAPEKRELWSVGRRVVTEPRHLWAGGECGLGAEEGSCGRMTTQGGCLGSPGAQGRGRKLSVLIFSLKPYQ